MPYREEGGCERIHRESIEIHIEKRVEESMRNLWESIEKMKVLRNPYIDKQSGRVPNGMCGS